jgi:hypothetical protein
MAQHKDTGAKTPRPSQAEGEREAIEEATGDRNNAHQSKRENTHRAPEETPRPSQAEGEDR